ncbi:MAG: thermonuclease family protein [Calditrichaeota bacterium]|nr:thermonuclease family protein [Calditrichota bacterium]
MNKLLSMNFYGIILGIVLILGTASAQSVKIDKILDGNRFLTSSGQEAQLAYVISPSVRSADPREANLARKIMAYAEKIFKEKRTEIIPVGTAEDGALLILVYQKFPLQRINVNLEYLRKGYGKFDPSAKVSDSTEYLKAQQKAKSQKLGIWNLDAYRVRYINPYHYLRVTAGFIPLEKNEIIKWYAIPSFTVGYHYGDLLPVLNYKDFKLSLSARADTYWLMFFPNAKAGPEINIKNFYARFMIGAMIPLMGFNHITRVNFLLPVKTFEAGFKIKKKNGNWIGLEWSYNRIGDERDDPLTFMRFMIVVPIL